MKIELTSPRVVLPIVFTFLILALCFALGFIVEHYEDITEIVKAIWHQLLRLLFFGQSFWGSIAIGGSAFWIAILLPFNGKEFQKMKFFLMMAILFAIGVISIFSVHTTFSEYADLNGYQKVALVALHVPVIPLILTLVLSHELSGSSSRKTKKSNF